MSDDLLRRKRVLNTILNAFDGVSRKGGVSLHQADVIDDYGSKDEQLKAQKLDKDHTWQGVPSADIAHYYWILSFLDPIGFRYYIAAYMSWSVKHLGGSSASIDGTVFALIPSDDKAIRRWQMKRFKLLNQKQAKAVTVFLRYMAKHHFESEAEEALRKYWSNFE